MSATNEYRISDAVRIALQRADVVITCGGLGPTVDDKTRLGVALAVDKPLVFLPDLRDAIAERFAMYRVAMSDNNLRQAYLPEGATVIMKPGRHCAQLSGRPERADDFLSARCAA